MIGAELNRAPLTATSITTSAALIGGGLRLSPFVVETAPSTWRGTVTFDLKTLMLDAQRIADGPRGAARMDGRSAGDRAWHGRASRASRRAKSTSSPFRNGLAAIVLKRELEKIEAFEKAAAERQRQFQAKQEAERLKAKAAADEAARQARIKEEAEKARREAERLQAEQQKTAGPGSRRAPSPFVMPPLTPPVELTPPPAIQVSAGRLISVCRRLTTKTRIADERF